MPTASDGAQIARRCKRRLPCACCARTDHERHRYFTNSKLNQIYAYDYDIETGNVSNRRVFIDAIEQGLPPNTFADGLCFDDKGGIWSARWNGGSIARFHGEDGTLDFVVHIPGVLNVTACAFGGKWLFRSSGAVYGRLSFVPFRSKQ